MNTPRPFYWSIRRELWENRFLWLAPLIASAMVLVPFAISTLVKPVRESVAKPYGMAAGVIVMFAGIAGLFYCLDALQGERRDRSILFWKSLPVSDRTTVLAKVSIPLIVLPLFSLVVILVTQLIMLLLSTFVLIVTGASVGAMWAKLPLFRMTGSLLYSMPAMALWYAPLYAWVLLVSAWARRVAALWVVLPFVALLVFERIAVGTSYVPAFIQHRLMGWFALSFATGNASRPMAADLTPGTFLSTPGLWLGLIVASLFLAAAMRLRRNREN